MRFPRKCGMRTGKGCGKKYTPDTKYGDLCPACRGYNRVNLRCIKIAIKVRT